MAINELGDEHGHRLHLPGVILVVVDSLAWVLGVLTAMSMRFDFGFETWDEWNPAGAMGIAVTASTRGSHSLERSCWCA